MHIEIAPDWQRIIEEWLMEHSVSQAALERDAGIGYGRLSKLFRGKDHPGRLTLVKLEQAMRVPAGTLVKLGKEE